MKVNNYINKIIEETGLTKEELHKMVEEKIGELRGLISEEGALFVIARELGVNISNDTKKQQGPVELWISDITPSMKNVVLFGRIKQIVKLFEYNKRNGKIGQCGWFLLNDKTGDIRVVVWDDRARVFNNSKFQINTLVKIINGEAKLDKLEKNLEIHIGRYGRISFDVIKLNKKNYPEITQNTIPINDINIYFKILSVEGKVVHKYNIKEYHKGKTRRIGRVLTILLADATGTIKVSFWDEFIDRITQINVKVGDSVRLMNFEPKLDKKHQKIIELHNTPASNINKIDLTSDLTRGTTTSIDKLQNLQTIVSFKGVISSLDDFKRVMTKAGEEISLLSFVVSDETDYIKVNLWRKDADKYSRLLRIGEGILLKNVMINYNEYWGRNVVNFIESSELEFIDLNLIIEKKETLVPLNQFPSKTTPIDLIRSGGIYTIKGYIAKDINNIHFYYACPKCFKINGNCKCRTDAEPINRMILNFVVEDESGTIRCSLFGIAAENLLGAKAEDVFKIKNTPDFPKFLERKSLELLGKEIIIIGRAKFSDYSNQFEISSIRFQFLDIEDQFDNSFDDIKETSNVDQNFLEISGQIKAETEKAILILMSNGNELWFPKSTIHSKYDNKQNYTQKFLIDSWFLEKNRMF